MSHSIELAAASDEKPAMSDGSSYRSLIGGLMYLAVCTRPNIAYSIGALARHMKAPTAEHWNAAKHVLRYISGTRDMGISYRNREANIVGYADADWGRNVDSRKSTTGYVMHTLGKRGVGSPVNGTVIWAGFTARNPP